MTQSAASRHPAVLEQYPGGRVIERRRRRIALTSLGKLFVDAVAKQLDSVVFTAERLRRQGIAVDRVIVRTPISTPASKRMPADSRLPWQEMG